jgi:hypothetical protein
MPPIVALFFWIIIVGVIVGVVIKYVAMPEPFKGILIALGVIVVLFLIANFIGIPAWPHPSR